MAFGHLNATRNAFRVAEQQFALFVGIDQVGLCCMGPTRPHCLVQAVVHHHLKNRSHLDPLTAHQAKALRDLAR